MKKYMFFSIGILFCFVVSILSYNFFSTKTLKIYNSIYIETDRECIGQFWNIFSSEENAKNFEKKYRIELPANDYKKYYLLISDGREINNITYKNISRFLWQYEVPKGMADFSDNFYEHKMICYRIEKKKLKQEQD